MVLFAFGFWYAFSSTEYSTKNHPRGTPLPLWRAIVDVINPWDLIQGIGRIVPLWGELRRAGDWKAWSAARKQQGLGGAIRKGVRKYQARKGDKAGRYQELDEGVESLTQRPMEAHHNRVESDTGYYPMSGVGGPDLYQPPVGSPPVDDSSAYLMADIQAGRPHAQSTGQYGEQPFRDHRSTSPAGVKLYDAPSTQGRDMV